MNVFLFSFRSFIQPATPWCPNPNPKWSLLRRRRRRMGQSTGRRVQRTNHATQTKQHRQRQNRVRQRTSPQKWTLTNCWSCQPLVSPAFRPAIRPKFCHSSEIVIDNTVASRLKTQTGASQIDTVRQLAFSACHFSFLWIQKYCVILILNGLLDGIKLLAWDGNCFLRVALMAIMWKIVLFSISLAHVR